MSLHPTPDHPRFAPVADGGLLVEFGEAISDDAHHAVLALDQALARDPPAGIGEAVPANASLLVTFDPVATDQLEAGRLVPLSYPNAMMHTSEAADWVLGSLESGLMPVVDGTPIRLAARSICIHGDSPGAVAMARHIRDRLQAGGVALQPFLRR